MWRYRPCYYVSSYTNPGRLLCCPWLQQLVMFVIDKVVEEDCRLLLASELESITLPDGTTRSLGPAVRDTFAIFEDLCLLGNGECPQLLELDYLHKMFALELIESVVTNYHQLFRKARVLSNLFHTSSPYIIVMFTASRALTLITTPPLPAASENTFRTLRFPSHTPRDSRRLSLA